MPEEVLAGACEEFLQRRQEIAELCRANAELKQLAGYWKAMHARAVQHEAKLTVELQTTRGEIRQLRDKLFGRKSEQPGRPGPGRRDYAHLPAVEKFVELSEDQQSCAQCGQPRRPLSDTEDSEQLEIEVRAHRRVILRRRNAATCQCPDQPRTLTAPAPPKLIPKSRLGTSVWVHLLLEKFCLHRPMERTLAALELCGLPLSAGTVTDGLRRLEPLFAGIYQALADRQVASDFSQADATRWLVFVEREGKQGYRWWLWVFLGDEVVVFRLDPTRSHEVPERHFPKEARLVLMVDRYSAYKAMVQVKQGGIVLVFCWAHVRRDFVEVGKGWPELFGTPSPRPGHGTEELLRFGLGVEWPSGRNAVLDLCHAQAVEAEPAPVADVVSGGLCNSRRSRAVGHFGVLAVESDAGAACLASRPNSPGDRPAEFCRPRRQLLGNALRGGTLPAAAGGDTSVPGLGTGSRGGRPTCPTHIRAWL